MEEYGRSSISDSSLVLEFSFFIADAGRKTSKTAIRHNHYLKEVWKIELVVESLRL